MNFWNHVKFNALFVPFISALAIYLNFLNFQSLLPLLIGATPYTFIITNDLDSPKSVVTQLWGPLNPYRSFQTFGHREALHHFFWGPFILITPFWMILQHFNVQVPVDCIIGAVSALEGHIVADCIYSEVMEIKKSWIGKIAEKVI